MFSQGCYSLNSRPEKSRSSNDEQARQSPQPAKKPTCVLVQEWGGSRRFAKKVSELKAEGVRD